MKPHTQFTKAFSADMTVEDGSREMLVKVTSNALDTDGEVLLPEGMDFKDFMQNPIVFANHSEMVNGGSYVTKDVVGKVVSLKRLKDHWIAKVFMLPRPDNHEGEWLADTLLHMARFGIMGVSVGAKYIEGRNPTKSDMTNFGPNVKRVISKWKIFELSIVPLPANQEALILAVSKGMRREAAVKFWPKLRLARKVDLSGMIKREWMKGQRIKAVQAAVRMELARSRGQIYFDG